MPKPNKNESKQDFLSRCTKDVINEGKEPDQAYAMCNAFWDDAKSQRQALTLTAPFELIRKDNETEVKEFMVTAYTGKVIDLGWFGNLIFDVTGMSAKEKFPVLREHKRDRIVGIGDRAWNDGKNFFIGGNFMTGAMDGKEVRDFALQGFPWQASVGIWPEKVKVLDDDKQSMTVNGQEIKGPAEVWLKSRVGEVSFVSLGADDDTAGIVMSDQAVTVSIERLSDNSNSSTYSAETKEDEKMEINLELLEKEAPDLLNQIREAAKDEGQKDGEAKERARVVEILGAGAVYEVAMKAISDGISADGAYKLFYQAEKEKKVAALKELEAQAPNSVGQEQPVEELEDPDMELALKARDLAQKENIPMAAAMRRVAKENPKLAADALPKFRIIASK